MTFKNVRRTISLFIPIGVGPIALIAFAYKFLFGTPTFLFDIEKSIEDDSALVNKLRGVSGYEIAFDRESKEVKKPFSVTVNGKCPNSYITIKGIYYENEGEVSRFEIQDTLSHLCN